MATYTDFFEKTFLFKGLTKEDIGPLLNTITTEIRSYPKGATVYSPETFDKKIGFIYQGECTVGRYSNGNVIPLNTSKTYDSFGILACFSHQDEFPTVITTKTPATIIFMAHDDLCSLLMKSSAVSLNIIEFLTRKINFLNGKIAEFSGGSIEEKLATHLLGLAKKYSSSEFSLNKKKSAEALNCGRASLYRSLEALANAGYITLEDKKIIINDLEGLERITK
jgi:CRP-like cAMP-binding protein